MIHFFAILSGITLFVSYYLYYLQVKRNISQPNPSSWFIWFFVMVINAFTYQGVIHTYPIKAVTAYVAVLCIILMCIYALKKGGFTRPNILDCIIFISSFVVGVFWQISGDPMISQLALQCILILSFIPTYIGLLRGQAKENPWSWFVVVLAYIFLIISIILDYDGNWIELMFPIVNGVIGNGIVAILALRQ